MMMPADVTTAISIPLLPLSSVPNCADIATGIKDVNIGNHLSQL